MTTVVGREVVTAVQVVIGVDAHQEQHVAVAIDQQGVRLAERYSPATTGGTGIWNSGPESWARFALLGSRVLVSTAPDLRATRRPPTASLASTSVPIAE